MYVAVTQNAIAEAVEAKEANEVAMDALKITTAAALEQIEVCAVSTLCITIVFITCVCHTAAITGCGGQVGGCPDGGGRCSSALCQSLIQ